MITIIPSEPSVVIDTSLTVLLLRSISVLKVIPQNFKFRYNTWWVKKMEWRLPFAVCNAITQGTVDALFMLWLISCGLMRLGLKDSLDTVDALDNEGPLEVVLDFTAYYLGTGSVFKNSILTPNSYLVLRLFILLLTLVWIVPLIWALIEETRPKLLLSSVASYLICVLDLICVVLLGIDYSRCLNLAGYNTRFENACSNAILVSLIVAARFFIFWLLNVVLATLILMKGVNTP